MKVYVLTAQKEIKTNVSMHSMSVGTFVIKTVIGVYRDEGMALRDAKKYKKNNIEYKKNVKWWKRLVYPEKYVPEIGLTYVIEEHELNEEKISK